MYLNPRTVRRTPPERPARCNALRGKRGRMRRITGLTRRHRYVAAATFAAAIAATVFGVVGAVALDGDPVQHGISVTKGCVSLVMIGEAYSCSFTIRNNVDEAHDTATVNSLVDTVHAAGGDQSSGNIFSTLNLVLLQGTAATPPNGIVHELAPTYGFATVHDAVRLADRRPDDRALHGQGRGLHAGKPHPQGRRVGRLAGPLQRSCADAKHELQPAASAVGGVLAGRHRAAGRDDRDGHP